MINYEPLLRTPLRGTSEQINIQDNHLLKLKQRDREH